MNDSYTKGDVDYRKVWKLMIDKDIRKKTDLIKMANISTNIFAKLNKVAARRVSTFEGEEVF